MWSRVVSVSFLCMLGNWSTHALAVIEAKYHDNGIDEPKTSDGCNPIQCDQNCRRIGFNGGACVGNRCKCDILEPDNMETSIPTDSVGSCDWSSCNSYCQTIGFITGYCLYDTCMCKYPKPTKRRQHTRDRSLDFDIFRTSITLGECNQGTCSRLCRRLGYDQQQCYGDKCECTHSQKGFDNTEGSETSCNGLQCDQLCRRLGFTGGACVGDKCKCDILMEVEVMIEPTPRSTKGSCNPRQCDQNCRKIGFNGGACVGGRSKIEPTLRSTKGSCNPLQCDQNCRKIGFNGGACVNGRCKCDILQEAETKIEPTLRSTKGSCNPLQCDQNCRKIGFNGGACVNGRCKCDILQEAENEMEATTHHLHRREASDCEQEKCDRLCRRVRYDNGVCVGARCKCDVLFPIKDSVIPTDFGGNCTPSRCGNFCSSIGFSGSNCVGIKCKCEILLQKEDNDIPPLRENVNAAINVKNL